MIPGLRSTPRRALAALAFTLTIAAVAAACHGAGDASPVPLPPGSRQVGFRAADGTKLSGVLFGDGRNGVVLSHQFNADQRSWYGFATHLAEKGYLVLTYDFRGYCPGGDGGCSAGDERVAAATDDLDGAVAFLRAQGARKVFLVGASMGGTASLEIATDPTQGIDGVIAVSAPTDFQGLHADPAHLGDVPKLFIAGRTDPAGAADAAQDMYDASPDPKQIVILPTDAHGAAILDTDSSSEMEQAMLRFLDLYRSAE